MAAMASAVQTVTTASNPHNFSWQQTMLRIKDPAVSVPFYEKNFGFTLIHRYDFPQWSFSLYFMATIPDSEKASLPTPGTVESEKYLWTMNGTCLELTHNHGSENDEKFQVSSGNKEPYRGFGHIAVMTPDVYAASKELEEVGKVAFQKRPDEGRMKGLAFALDPDGYWIEIVVRSEAALQAVTNKFTFAQTMKRVKDPVKSLHFYRDLMGMTLLRETHIGKGTPDGFSLYFLATLTPEDLARLGPPPSDITSPEASEYIKCMFGPILELTHNHGTENDPEFSYYNGNDQDKDQVRGFGHIGFLCDDLDGTCADLEAKGVAFKKKPQEGGMRGLAFAYDPDNYWVEIIQRGGLSLVEKK